MRIELSASQIHAQEPDAFAARKNPVVPAAYEDALKDLLSKKQKGLKIEKPKDRATSNVINLMDALRASLKSDGRNATCNRA